MDSKEKNKERDDDRSPSKKILGDEVTGDGLKGRDSGSEFFKKEVVYRSIQVETPQEFTAGVVHRGMAATLPSRDDFGIQNLKLGGGIHAAEEFRVPEGKQRHVGGSRQLPPAPPVTSYGELRKATSARELNVSSSTTKPMNLPGVEGVEGSILLSATAFENNCRMRLPALDLGLIVKTVMKCLENAKCDYEYLEKKAKWKAVTGLECNFLNFVCQLYNAPGNQDGYVFEIARREGDSIIFQKVWRSIREGLEAMNATDFKPEQLKVSPILDAPPPLSPALMEKAPKVDEESLQPLCHMVSSKILEQQLYAAQCTAKMVSSSNETRRVVGNSELIKKLTDCANHINMSEPLPLEHAILRHVTYTLAIVSEELLCAETLANSGCLELCFRVVVGVSPTNGSLQFDTSLNPNIMDLDSRREAARALANMCSFDGGYDELLKANIPDEVGLGKWCEFVEGLMDDKLRAQCKRVVGKVRNMLPQKVV